MGLFGFLCSIFGNFWHFLALFFSHFFEAFQPLKKIISLFGILEKKVVGTSGHLLELFATFWPFFGAFFSSFLAGRGMRVVGLVEGRRGEGRSGRVGGRPMRGLGTNLVISGTLRDLKIV